MQKNNEMKVGIVERANQSPHNKRILELLGSECIRDFEKFKYTRYEDPLTFKEAFGPDSKIYYCLEKHSNTALVHYETGFGYIEAGHFHRESPLYRGTDSGSPRPIRKGERLTNFKCEPDECLLIRAAYPETYVQALAFPHSVLSSSEHSPQITVLPEYSFLGRLGDNIEALTYDELAECPEFRALINKIVHGDLFE